MNRYANVHGDLVWLSIVERSKVKVTQHNGGTARPGSDLSSVLVVGCYYSRTEQ